MNRTHSVLVLLESLQGLHDKGVVPQLDRKEIVVAPESRVVELSVVRIFVDCRVGRNRRGAVLFSARDILVETGSGLLGVELGVDFVLEGHKAGIRAYFKGSRKLDQFFKKASLFS